MNHFVERQSLAWFEQATVLPVPDRYTGAGRLVHPGFMQLAAGVSAAPEEHLHAQLRLYGHLMRGAEAHVAAHDRFYDRYLGVMDLPAECYLDTIRTVFQQHDLPRGVLVSRSRPVEPRAIMGTALLTIEAEHDALTGTGQTEAAHTLCSSLPPELRARLRLTDGSHFDTFTGRRWRTEVLPVLRSFIQSHR